MTVPELNRSPFGLCILPSFAVMTNTLWLARGDDENPPDDGDEMHSEKHKLMVTDGL